MKVLLATIGMMMLGSIYIERGLDAITIARSYIFANLDSTVTGKIIESGVLEFGKYRSERYKVRYSYNIGNHYYIGSVVNYRRNDSTEDVLKKYPVGKNVQVYYDSTSPRYSVLEKTGISGGIVFNLFAVFIFTPFVGYEYYLFSSKK